MDDLDIGARRVERLMKINEAKSVRTVRHKVATDSHHRPSVAASWLDVILPPAFPIANERATLPESGRRGTALPPFSTCIVAAIHIWAEQAKVPAIRSNVGKRSGRGISPNVFETKAAW